MSHSRTIRSTLDESSIPRAPESGPVERRCRPADPAGSPLPARKATVASQMLDVLAELDVDTVFGIPGGAVSSVYGALLDHPGIRVVTAKHETGAVFLAMGHSLATNGVGVVVTTAGPGVTNAITGLASAYCDGVPVLMISGEVPTSAFGRGAFQEGSSSELDVTSLVRHCTKFAAQVPRPETAVTTLRRAVAASLTGRRGPSFVSIPLDVSASSAGEAPPIRGQAGASFHADVEGCREAMRLLQGAERPLILAGAGARGATNASALAWLVKATSAPVAVTPKGKGVFPEDHPLYLGVFGFGGHESVITYLRSGVDVVLVLGSGLDDFSTNAWSPLLRAGASFIQVDLDVTQLGRNYDIDLGLLGPMDVVIREMLRAASPRLERRGPRAPITCEKQPIRRSPTGSLTTPEVVDVMSALCPEDAVFTSDIGEHLASAVHYLTVKAPGEFITCLGLGAMGSGICAAIGYQIAAPRRRVYAICGDGGFLMHGAELVTAVQHGAAVTIVVINDGRLNMCHHGMQDMFGASTDMGTGVVDYAAIARGMGARGHVVETRTDLYAALREPPDGPVVLDVRVDPEIRLAGSQRDASLRQFRAP